MKYFAKIKYLGTAFHGFQVQPNARTVQGELTAACRVAFSADARVTGCSRTDAGVHANEFCVTIECDEATVPPSKLPMALARHLPRDISLYYAEECNEAFHPRYSAKRKEYLYRIKPTRISDPFDYGRVWLLSMPSDDDTIDKMKVASEYFIGEKDFRAFMSEGSDIVDTVRTVYSLDVYRSGEYIEVKISANGFLYNMVRIIVGTLVDVALNKILPEDIPNIIENKDRSKAGITAPPDGLYLNRVIY